MTLIVLIEKMRRGQITAKLPVLNLPEVIHWLLNVVPLGLDPGSFIYSFKR